METLSEFNFISVYIHHKLYFAALLSKFRELVVFDNVICPFYTEWKAFNVHAPVLAVHESVPTKGGNHKFVD